MRIDSKTPLGPLAAPLLTTAPPHCIIVGNSNVFTVTMYTASSRRHLVPLSVLLVVISVVCSSSAEAQDDRNVVIQPALFSGMKWRMVGPYRGGRSTAVAGIRGQPNLFFMGTTGGGVWRSDDAGQGGSADRAACRVGDLPADLADEAVDQPSGIGEIKVFQGGQGGSTRLVEVLDFLGGEVGEEQKVNQQERRRQQKRERRDLRWTDIGQVALDDVDAQSVTARGRDDQQREATVGRKLEKMREADQAGGAEEGEEHAGELIRQRFRSKERNAQHQREQRGE